MMSGFTIHNNYKNTNILVLDFISLEFTVRVSKVGQVVTLT